MATANNQVLTRGHTKFNTVVRTRIVSSLKAGTTLDVAARFGGISPTTLTEWLVRGSEDEDGEYREFFEDVMVGLADFEVRALQLIRKQGEKDWHALAWILERSRGSRWGRSDKVRIENVSYEEKRDDPSIHARIVEAAENGVFDQLAERARERRLLSGPLPGNDSQEPLDTDYTDAEATDLPA